MPVAANRARFLCSIAGADNEFRVLAFQGQEALSRLFSFELELISTRPDLDLDRLLNCDLLLQMSDNPPRLVHGSIRSIAQGTRAKRFTHYHIQISPRLYWLGLRRNVRIFQHLSVPDIIRQLLEEANMPPDFYRLELTRRYTPRIYTTQYNETDLAFIERLLSEEGIHYHFEHHPDRHVWVVSDHPSSFRPLEPRTLNYRPDAAMVGTPCVQRLSYQFNAATDSVTLDAHDYRKPDHNLQSTASCSSQPENCTYFWPGNYRTTEEGALLSRNRLSAARLHSHPVGGRSSVMQLLPGRVFQLASHPQHDVNTDYLITSLHHQGRQPQVLEEYSGEEGSLYMNEFEAASSTQEFRPPHLAKPCAGPQTAVVAGPSGEQIYTDEHGNIQVRFHWDRENQHSCWLRVARNWAGNFWGSMSVPRVGQEVVVEFLNGDPDQPVVSGCLYHALHKPPYPLPEHKSRTVLRSQSLAGGDGHELLLEDLADEEKIAIHSARNLELHITRDACSSTDRDTHTLVGGNSALTTQGSQHLSVHGERRTEISGQDSLNVGQAHHLKAGTTIYLQAGQDLHLKAGLKAALNAGAEVVLKAGASSLVLNPAGVFVDGPVVNLAGGGTAGAAAGASPAGAETASTSGSAKAGKELFSLTPQSSRASVLSFTGLMRQRHTLLNAAHTAVGMVEVCEKPESDSGVSSNV